MSRHQSEPIPIRVWTPMLLKQLVSLDKNRYLANSSIEGIGKEDLRLLEGQATVMVFQMQTKKEIIRGEEHIQAIARAVKDGDQIPPIAVERRLDGKVIILDGHHRTLALLRAGRTHHDAIYVRRAERCANTLTRRTPNE